MSRETLANGTIGHNKLNWFPVLGQWNIAGAGQIFLGEGPPAATQAQSFPVGLAVSSASMQTGQCRAQIRFSAPFNGAEQAAGIVVGYRSHDKPYVFAELGGTSGACLVGEFVSGFGWRPLAATGQAQSLQKDGDYLLELNVSGQELRVLVDGVRVLEHVLLHPLDGRQVGLIAKGNREISFSQFACKAGKPRAFVVMQFGEPYENIYKQVIQEQATAAGFEVFRIDEKAGPGVILQDMQREIEQAEVVNAEITPANPNPGSSLEPRF